jgi:hypothetical protein
MTEKTFSVLALRVRARTFSYWAKETIYRICDSGAVSQATSFCVTVLL